MQAEHIIKRSPCKRCWSEFGTAREREEHLQTGDCSKREPPTVERCGSDPEDGFEESHAKELIKRKEEDKIGDWATLYKWLFPRDVDVPTPCEHLIPISRLDFN